KTHRLVALGIVAPTFAYLDEQEKMYGRLDHLGDFPPRLASDCLYAAAGFAQHDFSLALALDVNRLLNADRAVFALLPALRLDCDLIWELLVQRQIDFLARDFRGKLAQRRVGELIRRIMPRPGRDMAGKPCLHIAYPVAGERRDHE